MSESVVLETKEFILFIISTILSYCESVSSFLFVCFFKSVPQVSAGM